MTIQDEPNIHYKETANILKLGISLLLAPYLINSQANPREAKTIPEGPERSQRKHYNPRGARTIQKEAGQYKTS